MLSSVLRSSTAIAVNIEIMRAFVELRRIASSYAALQERLEGLECEMTARLDQHDGRLEQIFQGAASADGATEEAKEESRLQDP